MYAEYFREISFQNGPRLKRVYSNVIILKNITCVNFFVLGVNLSTRVYLYYRVSTLN